MSDPLFHDGYREARGAVKKMTRDELLAYLDGLWGRDGLPDNPGDDDILQEALSQCRSEFTKR